jgi:hypothetical protein
VLFVWAVTDEFNLPVGATGDYVNISGYFWIPIVGPLIGDALASVFYDVFIQDILSTKATGARAFAEGETVQARGIAPPPPAPDRYSSSSTQSTARATAFFHFR